MAKKKTQEAPVSPPEDVLIQNEGESEGEDYNAVTSAHFFINVGPKKYRAIGLKDCWALQVWKEVKQEDALVPSGWREFKFFTDLGSLAGKIFDLRLKNSEATTLQELSDMAKQIRIDVRKEFHI